MYQRIAECGHNREIVIDIQLFDYMYCAFNLTKLQLKAFIQRASFNPRMDDNYYARSQDNKLHNEDDAISESTARYVIAFFVTSLSLMFIITVILLVMLSTMKEWHKKLEDLSKNKESNVSRQAKIFGVAHTMLLINVYILVLDGLALYTQSHKKQDIHKPKILGTLPPIVTSFDMLGMLFCLGCYFSGQCSQICCRGSVVFYLCLTISTLGPMMSLASHLPYIFIAYLNDSEHATSIFIYYTIILLTIFATLDISYSSYRKASKVLGRYMNKTFITCAFACLIPTLTVLVICLIAMITTTLAVVQISRSIGDASDRLLGFYQTVVVLIGAYFIYKKLFTKKRNSGADPAGIPTTPNSACTPTTTNAAGIPTTADRPATPTNADRPATPTNADRPATPTTPGAVGTPGANGTPGIPANTELANTVQNP